MANDEGQRQNKFNKKTKPKNMMLSLKKDKKDAKINDPLFFYLERCIKESHRNEEMQMFTIIIMLITEYKSN